MFLPPVKTHSWKKKSGQRGGETLDWGLDNAGSVLCGRGSISLFVTLLNCVRWQRGRKRAETTTEVCKTNKKNWKRGFKETTDYIRRWSTVVNHTSHYRFQFGSWQRSTSEILRVSKTVKKMSYNDRLSSTSPCVRHYFFLLFTVQPGMHSELPLLCI